MFNAMMWGGSLVAHSGVAAWSQLYLTATGGSIVSSKAGIDALAATGVEVGKKIDSLLEMALESRCKYVTKYVYIIYYIYNIYIYI